MKLEILKTKEMTALTYHDSNLTYEEHTTLQNKQWVSLDSLSAMLKEESKKNSEYKLITGFIWKLLQALEDEQVEE